MSAPDIRAVVHAALRTVQGSIHHLGLVTLEVLTDRVTEAVVPLLDAHRVEVLAEADLLPKADVVAWLLKRAHEYPTAPHRQENVPDAIAHLASKVERGAVRPDNLRVAGGTVLAVPVGSAPDFFEVGRTYTEPGDTTDWRFRCDAITTHPEDGERTALGWRHFRGEWSEYSYGEGDFEIHQIADVIGTTEESSK